MPKFEWTPDLSVNVTVLDDEHKCLIALINKLQEAMAQGQARTLVPDVLKELVNYTKTHFKNEESYMAKFDYPAYPQHKKLHDEFVEKVKSLIEDYQKNSLTLSIQIGNFLSAWITDHIHQVDMEYSAFMNEHGLK